MPFDNFALDGSGFAVDFLERETDAPAVVKGGGGGGRVSAPTPPATAVPDTLDNPPPVSDGVGVEVISGEIVAELEEEAALPPEEEVFITGYPPVSDGGLPGTEATADSGETSTVPTSDGGGGQVPTTLLNSDSYALVSDSVNQSSASEGGIESDTLPVSESAGASPQTPSLGDMVKGLSMETKIALGIMGLLILRKV